MKNNIVKLLFIAIIFALPKANLTNSFYTDQETTSGNTFTAGCWGEGIDCELGNPHLSTLWFYSRDDKQAVGFKLSGVSSYHLVKYQISYSRTGDNGSLDEVVLGQIDNGSGEESITKEWIFLGTCSDFGETCVNHQGVESVSIEVLLEGITDITLTTQISL